MSETDPNFSNLDLSSSSESCGFRPPTNSRVDAAILGMRSSHSFDRHIQVTTISIAVRRQNEENIQATFLEGQYLHRGS